MQKKLFRILSVFLAVVIVSVCFMQPIAYANAAVVGGGLVLLVAGLLITCGMVFTSQAQAETVANHTISKMPAELLETLAGYVGGADSNPNQSKFSLWKNGFAAAVSVGSAAFIAFKMWFDEYFGVNEETAAAGSVAIPTGIVFPVDIVSVNDISGVVHNLPVYRVNNPSAFGAEERQYYDSLSTPWFDMDINNKSFRLESFGTSDHRVYDINHSGYSLKNSKSYCYDGNAQNLRFVVFAVRINESGVLNSNYPERYVFGFYRNGYYDKYPYAWLYGFSESWGLQLSTNQASPTLSLLLDAYNHTIPEDQATVSIAIAEDMATMIEKDFRPIIDVYSLEAWDYNKDLEDFSKMIESVCADLDKLQDYDALKGQAEALKDALDRAREAAENDADVIGGVAPLDDAMYDAGKVIDKVREMIEEAEKDKDKPKDLDKIRDLEDEIAKAKEAIDELTKGKDIDVPVDPPITEGSKGKINWNILLNLFIFNKFPFSIPKDIYSFFDALSATPKEPVFVFDIFAGKFGPDAVIVLDFKEFEDIRKLVRNGVFIMLVIGLIAVTKKYIWK